MFLKQLMIYIPVASTDLLENHKNIPLSAPYRRFFISMRPVRDR